MALSLADLRKKREEAEAAAKAAALSPDEKALADELEATRRAEEDKAAADRARRTIDMEERVMKARAAFPASVTVKGLDLVDFFPLGCAPPAEKLPNGGVIVIRAPEPDAIDAASAEIEIKRRPLSAILGEMLCSCVVDPPAESAEAAKLSAFVGAYRGAATNAGDEVYKLGGMKAQAIKRGRA